MLVFWGTFFSVLTITSVLCDSSMSVPFLNCGTISPHLELREVIVKDCPRYPCTFKANEERNVTMILLNKDADLDPSILKPEGHLVQFGIWWTCAVRTDDPCSRWPCPLKGSHQEFLELSFVVKIQSNPLRRPGRMVLSLDQGLSDKPICASFDVVIV